MKLTLLETGQPPEPIAGQFPSYAQMFETLLGAADDTLAFETVSVFRGDPLPDARTIDAALITGSPAGVYDSDAWIAPLLAFIRNAAACNTPLVGICFGHQAIAEALGGKVEKSHKGWGIGRHTYTVDALPDWADRVIGPNINAAVSHQDQVVTRPPGADILARSDFTEFAALYYPGAPALTLQCHPEFDDAFAAALYGARRARLGAAADTAIASLTVPSDAGRLGDLITRFLTVHS